MENDGVYVCHDSRHRRGGPGDASEEDEPASKLPCLEDSRIRGNELITKAKVADSASSEVEQESVPHQSEHQKKEEIQKMLRETPLRHANLALKLYHEHEASVGHELELVRAISTCPIVRSCLWFHVNFIARPKNASDDKQQLYFAEIEHWSLNEDFLITFGPVKTEGVVSRANGCRVCEDHYNIYHPPPGQFEVGRPPHYGMLGILSKNRQRSLMLLPHC